MKKLAQIKRSNGKHWVGDGFPVRNIFSYNDIAAEISPFLLLDYGGPATFTPTTDKRGVGEHPHRGFETVTVVYEGEVEHRDSGGGGGKIGSGEVQWMTAASGVVHEEFHGRDFAKNGGKFEMVQLWVNLPKKDKMGAPRYQGITRETIPEVELNDGAGKVRVIAGRYEETDGPAKTYSPIHLWDIRLRAGKELILNVPAGNTCTLFVLSGEIQLSSGEVVREAELAIYEREGDQLRVKAAEAPRGEETKLLLMAGLPLNEPFVGHGPFVMSNEEEIRQAFHDYQSGKLGHLA